MSERYDTLAVNDARVQVLLGLLPAHTREEIVLLYRAYYLFAALIALGRHKKSSSYYEQYNTKYLAQPCS